MIGSEALPFSKTGGLADVLGALPLAVARLGHQVTLVTPKYRGVDAKGLVSTLRVPFPGMPPETRFVEQPLDERVRVVFVDRPDLYDREALYGLGASDYTDNARRFGFLARAAIEYAANQPVAFDIVHGHDWQAGLVPVYLKTLYRNDPRFSTMASVFTIHNLAYQGSFAPEWLGLLDLGPEMLRIDALEFWGKISFLKGGINFADLVTTVSPTYAKEIQTQEYGAGMEGVLAGRARDLYGVLNGIDVERWDPSSDPFLPEPYDERTLERKSASRRELLEILGPRGSGEQVRRPLVGIISRLIDQKGFDLIAQIADRLPALGFSFAVLGTGEGRYEQMWQALASAHPGTFGVKIGFDEPLAHLIEAAADIFLMPSRFEPCGLNQMYSMRYGTVPVVRATGGLDDTVVDYNPRRGAGTGFKFREYTPDALLDALERARGAFANPRAWNKLQVSGMRQDFSWDRSAREYVKMYEKALVNHGVRL